MFLMYMDPTIVYYHDIIQCDENGDNGWFCKSFTSWGFQKLLSNSFVNESGIIAGSLVSAY